MSAPAPAAGSAIAYWLASPGRGELREEPLPSPAPGEVRVRTLYSGISRGTEALVHAGRVPPGEYRRMRAPFQAGDFPGPVKYGYSTVGVVEVGPPGLAGRIVFCLHPHQSAFVVPESAVVPVPEAVPAGRAILAAQLETAVNALWDAPPAVGDRVVVVGGGTIGCLVAWLAARIPATRVELLDPDPTRAALAADLGFAWAAPDDGLGGADLVVHTSGTGSGLRTALGLAGLEATVLELSWYGDGEVAVALGGAFHSRRLGLRSSQVGRVPAARRARWSRRRRLALALDLLVDPRLDRLVGGEDRLQDLPRVMARLATTPGALCHRIRHPGAEPGRADLPIPPPDLPTAPRG